MAKPLELAHAQLLEQRRTQPERSFVIVGTHNAYTDEVKRAKQLAWRSYEVVEVAALIERVCSRSMGTYHADEVLSSGTPVALYVDVDVKRAANVGADLVGSVNRFVTALQEDLHAQYALAESACSCVILDASSAVKFSNHIVMQLAGNTAAFADAEHCLAFVHGTYQRLLKEETAARTDSVQIRHEDGHLVPLYDPAVYRATNQNFRLPGCSKLYAPERALVLRGTTTLTREQMAAGLVSSVVASHSNAAFLLHASDEQLEAAPLVRRRRTEAPRALITAAREASGDAPELVRKIALSIDLVAHAQPTQFVYDNAEARLMVRTASHDCRLFSRRELPRATQRAMRLADSSVYEHTSNHIFFVIDLLAGTFRQGCYDSDCSRAAYVFESLPELVLELARTFVNEHWSLAEPLGEEVARDICR